MTAMMMGLNQFSWVNCMVANIDLPRESFVGCANLNDRSIKPDDPIVRSGNGILVNGAQDAANIAIQIRKCDNLLEGVMLCRMLGKYLMGCKTEIHSLGIL